MNKFRVFYINYFELLRTSQSVCKHRSFKSQLYRMNNEILVVCISITVGYEIAMQNVMPIFGQKNNWRKFIMLLNEKNLRKKIYSRNYNLLLNTNKDRILWKKLLENKEKVFKNGVKICKPRLMMARMRLISKKYWLWIYSLTYFFVVVRVYRDATQPSTF